ncbi:hypothetical protein DRN44_09255 [Thermococci archaeon]|nr:MAG: hypothetical protein DRN44_09255 [Thermococci archaeon]
MVSTFKTIELGAIAAGADNEDTWTPERDITIKKIMINERSGAAVNAVKIYLSLAGQTYTKPFVPASAIGSNLEYCWKPNQPVAKGTEIYVKAENAGASEVNIDIVFEYE